MRLVAVEMSTCRGSLALLEEGHVMSSTEWDASYSNREALFDALKTLSLPFSEVDQWVVGSGPGGFSGMRISFSVVQALAAPSKTAVSAQNSGAAMALDIKADDVVVIGDARRDQWWAGKFKAGKLVRDYALIDPDTLAEWVGDKTQVITSDWDRLHDQLSTFNTPKKAIYPSAEILGQIACSKIQQGEPMEPMEPLYMHPPVFIEPRFK
jgi:tRNA threonylcarbamoyl adenosine modification protein YeaZ